jgi:hypothetical protein
VIRHHRGPRPTESKINRRGCNDMQNCFHFPFFPIYIKLECSGVFTKYAWHPHGFNAQNKESTHAQPKKNKDGKKPNKIDNRERFRTHTHTHTTHHKSRYSFSLISLSSSPSLLLDTIVRGKESSTLAIFSTHFCYIILHIDIFCFQSVFAQHLYCLKRSVFFLLYI